MNLYVISQHINHEYDTFGSVVVAARSRREARSIHPRGQIWPNWGGDDSWVHPSDVRVTYIGQAKPGTSVGVISASFRAG